MWCKHCRQDVPALAAAEHSAGAKASPCAGDADAGRYLCTRCGEPIGSAPTLSPWTDVSDLGIDLTELAASAGLSEMPKARGAKAHGADAAARYDAWQWELDQELHDVRRLLTRHGAAPRESTLRVDPPRYIPQPVMAPALNVAASPSPAPLPVASTSPRAVRQQPWAPLAWFVLMLGVTATCCGGALLGWSVFSGRMELWSRGVPILIGGQAALFIALLSMLLRLGRHSQATAAQLHEVNTQLTTLGAPSRTSEPSFYVHLAEGAQPQALVADLRNQLDLLAIRLRRQ